MKVTLCVASIFLLCVVANGDHASWGIIGPNDTRANYEIVKKSSSFAQIVTKDVKFPQVCRICFFWQRVTAF